MLSGLDLWMMEQTVGADISGNVERAANEIKKLGAVDEATFDAICDSYNLSDAQRRALYVEM